jgi:cytochrome c oxidase subunit 1
LLFVYIIWNCARGSGVKASDKVWDGAAPHGLEWTVASPAPYHSFETPPDVK